MTTQDAASAAGSGDWRTWTVRARNLPEHARNPIHTDAGAQAAGFPRALVAGVTTYAYLTRPVIEALGLEWLRSGGAEVRFRSPVFDGDPLRCAPTQRDAEAMIIEAQVDQDQRLRATLEVVVPHRSDQPGSVPAQQREGEALEPVAVTLQGEFGAEYGERAGDDLELYRRHRLVHPAVWPALANQVVHTQVASGSWVHTRSLIRHHRLVDDGSTAEVTATVVNRTLRRSGERAVLDVRISVDGAVVVSIEHEAIVSLPDTA